MVNKQLIKKTIKKINQLFSPQESNREVFKNLIEANRQVKEGKRNCAKSRNIFMEQLLIANAMEGNSKIEKQSKSLGF